MNFEDPYQWMKLFNSDLDMKNYGYNDAKKEFDNDYIILNYIEYIEVDTNVDRNIEMDIEKFI